MTDKRIIRLFALEAKIKKIFKQTDRLYTFPEIINYLNDNKEKFELLKELRPKFRGLITFKSNVIAMPSNAELNVRIPEYVKLIHLYEPFAKASNQDQFKTKLEFVSNYYYELTEPYRTIKIAQHKDVMRPYFTYIQMIGDEIMSIKHTQPSMTHVHAPPKKTLGPRHSLGHTSFGRNANARLLAEAHDPPGLLIVTEGSLPLIAEPYKYKTSAFTLESESFIGTEKCQIVMFETDTQRESFPTVETCKYFKCNFFLPN